MKGQRRRALAAGVLAGLLGLLAAAWTVADASGFAVHAGTPAPWAEMLLSAALALLLLRSCWRLLLRAAGSHPERPGGSGPRPLARQVPSAAGQLPRDPGEGQEERRQDRPQGPEQEEEGQRQ